MITCSAQKPSFSSKFDHLVESTRLSSVSHPFMRELQRLQLQVDIPKIMKTTGIKLVDAFVDSVFEFVDQTLLPSQSNFAPVDQELKEAVIIAASNIEGRIPDSFSEGVYIRNGANPLFGGLKSTSSMFGRSSHVWVEGEGMLHALYFDKRSDGTWAILYNNRHVETETYRLEKQRNKPSFIPATEGDSLAVVSAYVLNFLRFGKVNKDLSNTNVFEHAGNFYSIAENYVPQMIDIFTLEYLGDWNINGSWNRPFTSHPKRAPCSGELVIIGIDATKPFLEVGVISADGKMLVHKVDIKVNRGTICHDIGVTERYNVILDFPLYLDINRLMRGGPLIKYNKEGYAKIGVMPRHGDGGSVKWFDVEPNCTFHILNCFEDDSEVVVWGCRAHESIIPGPDLGLNKFEWFSTRLKPIESGGVEDESLFSRAYEWRLNMKTGEVKERYLTGIEFAMDFPMINVDFTGLKNRYGYTQVVDSIASSASGLPKYGGLAKLYLEEQETESEGLIRVEYHHLEEHTFCTGAAFVPKEGGTEEDDGWIITFVHNEDTNISQAYIIDTKKFTCESVAKITLPCRVPYGFHGAFMRLPKQISQELSSRVLG
ncbi:carotenoid 9,10(9',10')-cleavage dioxygenase 1-like [Tripterygium wilfordii]|uniref:carotenoid 9,10(9',10')-cleavage dioxygenase 1-like n=1 Tax=Tripterygium wilfordii TaxID=458696 RepID=UPI0018F83DBB|nr:carotenoid 9,10(9',10')-cleavage dioxygenase 1-like [Tripterygium wilfordii]XP_038699169.1 carotenoid 9,10(9',10')-cleavage dioxygenase 1-like [Tripterygium wilfordii]